MMTLAVLLVAVVCGGFLVLCDADRTVLDRLFDRRRRYAVVVSTALPVVAVDASQPKARVTEIWANRGWRSIVAEPVVEVAPLLLTWTRPEVKGIEAPKARRTRKAKAIETMTVPQLRAEAKARGIAVTTRTRKPALLALLAGQAEAA